MATGGSGKGKAAKLSVIIEAIDNFSEEFRKASENAERFSEALDKASGSYNAFVQTITAIRGELTRLGEEVDVVKKALQNLRKSAQSTAQSQDKMGEAAKDTAKGLKDVGEAADKAGDKLDSATKDTNELKESMDQAKDTLQKVGRAFLALTAASRAFALTKQVAGVFADLSGSYADLELQIKRIEAISGASADAMLGVAKAATSADIAMKGFAGAEVAETMFEFARAGQTIESSIIALPSITSFAVAGTLDLKDALNTALGVMFSFKTGADGLSKSFDIMTRAVNTSRLGAAEFSDAIRTGGAAAQIANQDLASFLGAIRSMREIGITASMAGTAFKTAMMQSIIGPAKDAQDVIAKYGLRFRDAAGNVRPFADIIEELEVKLGGLSRVARDAALADLFGTRGIQAAVAGLSVGSKALRAWTQDLRDAGDETDRVANVMLEALFQKVKALGATFENFKAVYGETMAPFASDLVAWLTRLLQSFIELDDSVKKGLLVTLGVAGLAGALLAVAGAAAGVVAAISLITGLSAGVIVGIGGIALALSAAIGALVGFSAAAEDAFKIVPEGFDKLKNEADQISEASKFLAAALREIQESIGENTLQFENTAATIRDLRNLGTEFNKLHGNVVEGSEKHQRYLQVLNAIGGYLPSVKKLIEDEAVTFENVNAAIQAGVEERLSGLEKMRDSQELLLRQEQANVEEQIKVNKGRLDNIKASMKAERGEYNKQKAFLDRMGTELGRGSFYQEISRTQGGRAQDIVADVERMIERAREYVKTHEEREAAWKKSQEAAQTALDAEETKLVEVKKKLQELLQFEGAEGWFAKIIRDLFGKGGVEQLSEEMQKITDNALTYWEKYLRSQIVLAPNDAAKKKAEDELNKFRADYLAFFDPSTGLFKYDDDFYKFFTGIQEKLVKVTQKYDNFFKDLAVAVRLEQDADKAEKKAEETAKKIAKHYEDSVIKTVQVLQQLMKAGEIDPDQYVEALRALEESYSASGKSQLSTILKINDASNDGVKDQMEQNTRLFRLRVLNEEQYLALQESYIALWSGNEEGRVEQEAKVYEQIAKLRQADLNADVKAAEAKRRRGEGSYADVLDVLATYIAQATDGNEKLIALREQWIEKYLSTEQMAQEESDNTRRFLYQVGVLTTEEYKAQLEERLSAFKGNEQKRQALANEYKKLVEDTLYKENTSLFRARAISEEQYINTQLAFLSVWEKNEAKRIEASRKVYDEVNKVRKSDYDNEVKEAERRISLGQATTDDLIAINDRYLSKVRYDTDQSRKFFTELADDRVALEQRVRDESTATMKWEVDMGYRTISEYKAHLEKRLASFRDFGEKRRSLMLELQQVTEQADFIKPLAEQDSWISLVQTKIQSMTGAYEALGHKMTASMKTDLLEEQADWYEVLIEKQIQNIELLIKRAQAEKDTVKKNTFLQEALEAEQGVYQSLQEFQEFGAKFPGRFGSEIRAVTQDAIDALDRIGDNITDTINGVNNTLFNTLRDMDQTRVLLSQMALERENIKLSTEDLALVLRTSQEVANKLGESVPSIEEVVTAARSLAGRIDDGGAAFERSSRVAQDAATILIQPYNDLRTQLDSMIASAEQMTSNWREGATKAALGFQILGTKMDPLEERMGQWLASTEPVSDGLDFLAEKLNIGKDAIEELNRKYGDAKDEVGGGLEELRQALGGAEEGTAKAKTASEIMAEAAEQLRLIVGQQSSASDAAGNAATVFSNAAGELTTVIPQITSVSETTAGLAGTMETASGNLTTAVGQLQTAAQSTEGISRAAQVAVSRLVELLPDVAGLAGDVVSSAGRLTSASNSLSGVFNQVDSSVGDSTGNLADATGELTSTTGGLQDVLNTARDASGTLSEASLDLLTSGGVLGDRLGELQGAVTVLREATTGLANIPPELQVALQNVETYVGNLTGASNQLNDAAARFPELSRSVEKASNQFGTVVGEQSALVDPLRAVAAGNRDAASAVNLAATNFRGSASTMQTLGGSLADAVTRAAEGTATAKDVASTAGATISAAEDAAQAATEGARNVQRTVPALDSAISNLTAASGSSEEATTRLADLIPSFGDIVTQIARAAESIGVASTSIQTNLSALGDLAGSMEDAAGGVRTASSDIVGLTTELQSVTSASNEAIRAARDAATSTGNSVGQLGEVLSRIETAVTTIGAASTQLDATTRAFSTLISNVTATSGNLAGTIGTLSQGITDIRTLSAETQTAAGLITTGAADFRTVADSFGAYIAVIGDAAEPIKLAGDQIAGLIPQLSGVVGQFAPVQAALTNIVGSYDAALQRLDTVFVGAADTTRVLTSAAGELSARFSEYGSLTSELAVAGDKVATASSAMESTLGILRSFAADMARTSEGQAIVATRMSGLIDPLYAYIGSITSATSNLSEAGVEIAGVLESVRNVSTDIIGVAGALTTTAGTLDSAASGFSASVDAAGEASEKFITTAADLEETSSVFQTVIRQSSTIVDQVRNSVAGLYNKEEIVASKLSEIASEFGSQRDRIAGALQDVNGKLQEMAQAIRDFGSLNSDIATSVAVVGTKMDRMDTVIEDLSGAIRRMPDTIEQNFDIDINGLSLAVAELRTAIRQQVMALMPR